MTLKEWLIAKYRYYFPRYTPATTIIISGVPYSVPLGVEVKVMNCVRVTIGGEVVYQEVPSDLKIRLRGDLLNLNTNLNVNMEGDVHGNLTAGSNVHCGDVGGNALSHSNMTCGDVGGNARSGSNMACGNVQKDVIAGSNVSYQSANGEISSHNHRHSSDWNKVV